LKPFFSTRAEETRTSLGLSLGLIELAP
jgi:hypothetical protein